MSDVINLGQLVGVQTKRLLNQYIFSMIEGGESIAVVVSTGTGNVYGRNSRVTKDFLARLSHDSLFTGCREIIAAN